MFLHMPARVQGVVVIGGVRFYGKSRRDRHTLELVFSRPQHKVFDGFARVFAFVEDQLHLLGDGHFDVVLAG